MYSSQIISFLANHLASEKVVIEAHRLSIEKQNVNINCEVIFITSYLHLRQLILNTMICSLVDNIATSTSVLTTTTRTRLQIFINQAVSYTYYLPPSDTAIICTVFMTQGMNLKLLGISNSISSSSSKVCFCHWTGVLYRCSSSSIISGSGSGRSS